MIWPDEPENLDLTELREIRAELEKLHGLERRFDALDKRFDEMRAYVYCSLGLGTVNSLKSAKLEARIAAFEQRPPT